MLVCHASSHNRARLEHPTTVPSRIILHMRMRSRLCSCLHSTKALLLLVCASDLVVECYWLCHNLRSVIATGAKICTARDATGYAVRHALRVALLAMPRADGLYLVLSMRCALSRRSVG